MPTLPNITPGEWFCDPNLTTPNAQGGLSYLVVANQPADADTPTDPVLVAVAERWEDAQAIAALPLLLAKAQEVA